VKGDISHDPKQEDDDGDGGILATGILALTGSSRSSNHHRADLENSGSSPQHLERLSREWRVWNWNEESKILSNHNIGIQIE
jgi:hypothetical protein